MRCWVPGAPRNAPSGVPSMAPTPSDEPPSFAPTHLPTELACDHGSAGFLNAGCDTETTMAVQLQGLTECVCECLEGFLTDPNDRYMSE